MVPISDLIFHQRLGRVLEHLGDEGFWAALAGVLRHSTAFDSWVALIFRPGRSPHPLGVGGEKLLDEALFAEYVQSFYEIDPYYLFSLGEFAPGLYRLDDVAPEYFQKTEYYQRYFALNVVADEVQFLLPMPPHGTLSFSLGCHHRFTNEEMGWLCLVLPWLLPLMKASADMQIASAGIAPDRAVSLEARLRQKGTPALTDRETQIALLLLAGHSSKAIAARLDISPETVKVHRRNLYEKLGVSSQAEVFALFMTQG
ncbi:helix-turn-helix transcriptional regulator [Acidocella sp.]|uniref:helix-turn-helix transcriptional regulator n=1 Tax=Acidocella sp. TaxID=50710 RepID=UPI003D06B547